MSYKAVLKKDPVLASIIKDDKNYKLEIQNNIFTYLCASIVSQQLSTKVAKIINQRFLDLFKGEEPSPAEVLKKDHDTYRSIGFSNSKANYIKNVAEFHLSHGLELEKFEVMSDKEVVEYLTQIKGVGRWTVEMLLMFALAREDVFPDGDLGIQQAMTRHYNLGGLEKKKLLVEMNKIAENWRPFRTYASLHLWGWGD